MKTLVVLMALVSFASAAQAQVRASAPTARESSDRKASAQAAFEQGLSLASEERWLEARAAFSRSIELSARASTYFNLALVSLELGLGRAALDALANFDALADAQQRARHAAQAATLRERAKGKLGTLVLSVDPEAARVEVDGVRQTGHGAERVLLLDPGEHVIRVEADAREPQTLRLSVTAQAAVHRRVELGHMHAPATPATIDLTLRSAPERAQDAPSRPEHVPSSEPEPRDDPSLLERPLFWVITASVLVVAAGATTGALLLSREDGKTPAPYGGSSGRVLDPSK